MPDVELFTVEEVYPVKGSADRSCKNGAETKQITQIYYNCHQNSAPDVTYRTTYQTYQFLTTLPYYQSRVTCEQETTSNDVCYCPSGFTGYLCDTAAFNKCYVNITEPALYKGCSEREDSEYYVYSIHGFDPCFYFDFSKTYTMKFLLQCRAIDEKGIVLENGHSEGVGFEYADVIKAVESGVPEGQDVYKYAAVNSLTKLKVQEGQNMTVTWDFRDWKYLS